MSSIVAFDDYQCPFCARFHAPILEVLKAYPDKVNFMIKNFPLDFHPQAIPAAKAVLAAGEQGKYFEMSDALLADNKDLSEERFKKEAEKLLPEVTSMLDKLAKTNVIHKNKAANLKSSRSRRESALTFPGGRRRSGLTSVATTGSPCPA